jgi:hypothetical protein
VVSLALEKRLFLNVPGSAYWCHLSAKSFAISTNGTIRSELSRLLISQNFLPKGGTTGHFRDALRSKRFFRTSGTTALRVHWGISPRHCD